MKNSNRAMTFGLGMVMAGGLLFVLGAGNNATQNTHKAKGGKLLSFDAQIRTNAQQMLDEGRQIFRFDTFGDEAFWGGMLKLHQAIEGATAGGVGSGLSPQAALDLGLKVDVD